MTRSGELLTHRQLEVLELMAKGLQNPEIARVLGIRLSTVKTHVSAVIDALGVSNRTEAAVELERLRAGSGDPGHEPVPGFGERPAIAFLPLDDGGAVEDWFAEGLVGDLTRAMGGVRWFPVIDRGSMLAGSRAEQLAEIGWTLGTRYVVDGSLSRDGDRLVLSVRLYDVAHGGPLWAERLDVSGADLFAAQQEAVRLLVKDLQPALLEIERVHRMRIEAERIAVWELCQRAQKLLGRETGEDIRRAHALLEEATQIDPGSPRAWAGLAHAWNSELYLGFVEDPRAHAARAREAASRALERAPEDADAHLAYGRAFSLSLETAAAIPHLERAIELNPSRVQAYKSLAAALRREGRPAEAIGFYERALRLSPREPGLYHVHGGLAVACLATGDYARALEAARSAVADDPENKPLSFHWLLPAALALLGRIEEAQAAFARVRSMPPESVRHSARFAGEEHRALLEGLRLAGWDGTLPE